MDIIRLNGKVWGYYWQSMDNIGFSYTFIDIIRNTTITFIKVAKYTGQDRAKYDIIVKNGHRDRKSTRLNSSHVSQSRMPSSA